MAQPYVGEIRIFAGNFAPVGWMLCEGQLLPISENQTLFQLIGTTYGGDGQSTFALPDLRGRLPVHVGSAYGENFNLAQAGGVEEVLLSVQQIPAHAHALLVSAEPGQESSPAGNVLARARDVDPYSTAAPTASMNASLVSQVGGSQPHTNFQPYLCVDFIISLFGIFPSQT